MKFFLDENIPLSVVDVIRTLGFDAEHARTVNLRGVSDKEIASYAKKQKAILVTKDLEFGSLVLYPKGSHYGIVIMRLPHSFTAQQLSKACKDFVTGIDQKSLEHKITVLELGRYRTRKLEP